MMNINHCDKKKLLPANWEEIDNRMTTNTNANAGDYIPTDKQYPKLSKASSGYLEIEQFKNADLHTGYFCYNCAYFIKPNHCAIVEDSGPDVYEKESGIISPYGLCTLWDPNEQETH